MRASRRQPRFSAACNHCSISAKGTACTVIFSDASPPPADTLVKSSARKKWTVSSVSPAEETVDPSEVIVCA